MSKCCVVQLPAMGKCCEQLQSCCDPHSFTGEREFTIKVKVRCAEGDEGCRIELSHEGCCTEADSPAAKQ